MCLMGVGDALNSQHTQCLVSQWSHHQLWHSARCLRQGSQRRLCFDLILPEYIKWSLVSWWIQALKVKMNFFSHHLCHKGFRICAVMTNKMRECDQVEESTVSAWLVSWPFSPQDWLVKNMLSTHRNRMCSKLCVMLSACRWNIWGCATRYEFNGVTKLQVFLQMQGTLWYRYMLL